MTKKGFFKRFWQDYNLSIVLLGLFLASWSLQFLFEMQEVANEAHSRGQAFEWKEFFPHFFSGTIVTPKFALF